MFRGLEGKLGYGSEKDMVRITGGKLSGRRLKGGKGSLIRPTADRVKESVFAILGERLAHGRILDLCAGTGALGLEALSRGASFVVFVDEDPKACRIISENLAELKLTEKGLVRRAEAYRFLAGEGSAYDVVFFDPPYREGMVTPTVERISQRGILEPTGTLVVETSRHEVPLWPISLECRRKEKYGETVVYFVGRKEGVP